MALFSTLSRNPVALSSSILARRSGWLMRASLHQELATLALYGPFVLQTQQRAQSEFPKSDSTGSGQTAQQGL